MIKGLLNGSILLAGIGFAIIVMTTPNASLEIMSQLSSKLELKMAPQDLKQEKYSVKSSHYTEISSPDYYNFLPQTESVKS